ncbi:MAG: cytochrome c [Anaerolineae bacterium]
MSPKIIKRFLIRLVLLSSVLFLLVPASFAGGWAVVTLDEWPAEVVAGKPFQLGFMIRQHGRTPWSYDGVMVQAVHLQSQQEISAKAQATGSAGHYQATLEFPQAGTWRWSIESGLFPQEQPLPDLIVLDKPGGISLAAAPAASGDLAPGTPFAWPLGLALGGGLGAIGMFLVWRRVRTPLALVGFSLTLVMALTGLGLAARTSASAEAAPPAPVRPDSAAVERGRALFMAKGCIVCHRHPAVKAERQRFGSDFAQFSIGPDLPTLTTDPQLLKTWLADPSALKPNTDMPNLKLSRAEIEALVAFLVSSQ